MIPAGTVNALVAWAHENDERIGQLRAERDACVDAFLNGGQANGSMASASANGKSFAFFATMTISREEKLSLLTEVLTQLGDVADPRPSVTFADFSGAVR